MSAKGSPPDRGLPLFLGDEHPCPYLQDRRSRNEFTFAQRLEPAVYQRLMDLGFRRSGLVVYRPVCEGCRECLPIRVPVASFRPSKSQRRAWRRNQDVTVTIGTPRYTEEKWDVYARYLADQHDGTMSDDPSDLQQFLYTSATDTLEFVYRLDGKVVAVGIVDAADRSLSSVYFFFDPAHGRRSLGVFGALVEIEECRRRGLPHWYLGYYIRECRRMNYKADYRPCELLTPDGRWEVLDADRSR